MIFIVKSSDNLTTYKVDFNFGEVVQVQCDCPAGIYGKHCKHKMGLLQGDTSLLADPNQSGLLTECLSRLDGSDIFKAIQELNACEHQLSEMKKICEKKKKSLEKILQGK